MSVVASDPNDFPNTGIETNLTGFHPGSVGPLTAFQAAAEETIGAYDAVFGLFENSTFGPDGFFEVFTTASDQPVHLDYGDPNPSFPGGAYLFRLASDGNDTWELTVDGRPFSGVAGASTFDFGTDVATGPGSLAFSEVAFSAGGNGSVAPQRLVATTAVAVEKGSSWYLPENATVDTIASGAPTWGIEGRAQSSLLAPGEIESGSAYPALANGTLLWTGGPVPVDVSVDLGNSTVVATLLVSATATVTSPSGSALSGVPVAISDSLGGAPTAPGNLTGPTGEAVLGLVTPNVSAPVTDLVTIATTILGFVGTATVPLTLTPAVELTLSESPGVPSVPVNGTIELAYRALGPGARPSVATLIEFSSSLGGRLSLAFGISDSSGRIALNFTAGPSPGTVSVVARVVAPGVWGRLSIVVTIVPASPNRLLAAETAAVVGLAGTLIAIIIVIAWRRPRTKLPELPGVSPDPAPTRTPPS